MGEISCRWAGPRLALLAGGDLSGDDRRKLERHLIVCSGCQTRFDSLRLVTGLLRSVPSTEIAMDTPSLWPAVARQIRESKHVQPAFFGFKPIWTVVGLAASFVAATGLSLWSWSAARTNANQSTLAAKEQPHKATPPKSVPIVAETSTNNTLAEAAPAPHKSENEPILKESTGNSRLNALPNNSARIGVDATH